MPRPRKCRRVCRMPATTRLCPQGMRSGAGGEAIQLAVEEYETIRLIDYYGMTQEECAVSMNVARATVQSIYAAARKKLAQCLVDGRELKVTGGEYRLCQASDAPCFRCWKKDASEELLMEKEGMRIE